MSEPNDTIDFCLSFAVRFSNRLRIVLMRAISSRGENGFEI